jgi:hypothetical protein
MNYSNKWMAGFMLVFLILGLSSKAYSQTYTTGVVTLSGTAGVAMTAKIDIGTQVTLTLTGPSGRWFALGFNANSMAGGTDVVSVHNATTLSAFDCNLTGYSAPATDAQQNWTITSDATNAGVRTVTATRSLATGDANDYAFSSTPTSVGLIWARSSTASFSYSYHGSANRGATLATFTQVQPPSAPTGSANQTLCSGATVAQISAGGTGILWYSSPTGGSPLANNTPLVNGSTYYATQTVNGLESTSRLAVTVTLNSVPAAPSAINGLLHFCYTGGGQQYSISSVQGATSYVWNTPNGSTGSSIGTNLNLLFSPSFQSGGITVQAQNSCGQSSPVSIVINQHLQSSTTLNVTSCTPYVFNGQTYTQSGTYNFQGSTIWGCDSSVVLNLTIATVINQNVNEDACGSYAWNGQSIFTSGIYTDTLQTLNGCDSIVTLDLTIHPIESISLDSTVFDSFNWNGTVYTTSGTYTQFFTSAFGCDSSVTINLTVLLSELSEEDKQFSIYPNPVGDQRQLFIHDFIGTANFKIRDIQGKIIQEGITDGTIFIVESLNYGIYYLELENQVFKVVLE